MASMAIISNSFSSAEIDKAVATQALVVVPSTYMLLDQNKFPITLRGATACR